MKIKQNTKFCLNTLHVNQPILWFWSWQTCHQKPPKMLRSKVIFSKKRTIGVKQNIIKKYINCLFYYIYFFLFLCTKVTILHHLYNCHETQSVSEASKRFKTSNQVSSVFTKIDQGRRPKLINPTCHHWWTRLQELKLELLLLMQRYS